MSPFAFWALTIQTKVIFLIGSLAPNAGTGFAIARHGSAVVFARLVVTTQIAVFVGTVILMVAILGAFVVVVARARF